MDNELYKIFEKTYFNHKYYLKEFKGAGAFGAVFLADEVVGGTKIQEVAIKAIRKDKMPSDIIAKELVTAIRLKHPNLINCITSEEGRLKHLAFNYDCYGLVMEIASGTLEDYLQASRVLPVSEVREIVEAIASGLVYLHGQSVTHRDLKPANVLRVGNVWKISDFGIARQMSRESGTMTSNIMGTQTYMPPEAYASYSVKISPAWDIWSLGVMIVVMLTGELPFDRITDIWKMKINIKGDLPPTFNEIVQNCLLKAPTKRWKAKQILNKNIEFNPEEADEYLDIALNKLGEGHNEESLKCFNEAIRINPNYVEAYFYRATVKFRLDDVHGAVTDYTTVIRLDPKHAEAYVQRGILNEDYLNDSQAALSDYSEAILANSEHESAYLARGFLKSKKLGDKYGAIADYDEAVRIADYNSSTYEALGDLKCDLENWQQAISAYSKGINLLPDSARLYLNRGLAKLKLGDINAAIADFNESIRLNCTDNLALAYGNRGRAKSKLRDNQGAISDFNEAIRISHDHTEIAGVYINRGLAKSKLGDKNGALLDFRIGAELCQKQGDLDNYNKACRLIQGIEST
ncbi:protein kinase [Pseudanabaena sp. FACHB-1998]|uniref:protein kinase domain-containing protein n=1 Tax=Pseudanabaena sp. FACHB-1998 TaxID=2692858 RepID=UPI001680BB6A|nr:protein kinase [Pseudanabaena sp. FACHB-1998]MBD2179355.1 protein kinase [Pseudanabaena sp. FACHB-1998]